ncbi:hypothetical protein [Nonomuraea sp. NPDC049400]|uniref:hypothetical protein n=1 Tax=Nonomuraea sp. NPDC049400 TaxID=3364352 RepID=UPI00379E0330
MLLRWIGHRLGGRDSAVKSTGKRAAAAIPAMAVHPTAWAIGPLLAAVLFLSRRPTRSCIRTR